MWIALRISVFLFVYNFAEAQLNYVKQSIPQQVKYDDEVPVYDGIHYKPVISNEPSSNLHENSPEVISRTEGSPYPQPEYFHHIRPVPSYNPVESAHQNPSQDHPQVIDYRQPESHKNYPSQDHTSRPEELLPSHHRPSHASIIYPQTPAEEPLPNHRRPSHASIIYPQTPAEEHQQLNVPQSSLIYPKPAEPKYYQESTPDSKQPVGSQTPNSRVVRDPRLPLYFTMYEKRIVQDPVDKYGKGPWRYLTYGHGITYGSKEPGKVFEKGYGYIRALGRDHCKLPENKCPKKNDDKPFEYEGRKEPYFGYRPH